MLVPVKSYIKLLDPEQKIKFGKWCKENNVIKWDNKNKQWFRIIPNPKNIGAADGFILSDHRDIFKMKNGNKIWVIQPYSDEGHLISYEIQKWANDRGLSVKIDPVNSWYDEKTVLVQFEVQDTSKAKEYIKTHKRPVVGSKLFYIG